MVTPIALSDAELIEVGRLAILREHAVIEDERTRMAGQGRTYWWLHEGDLSDAIFDWYQRNRHRAQRVSPCV